MSTINEKYINNGLLALVIFWLFVVYFHKLSNDELEHSHVAWLMGKHSLIPVRDFFQHHMPLLWDILKQYYIVGGSGTGVIYFGRCIVLVCAVLTIWGLRIMGKPEASMELNGHFISPGLIAICYFIFATGLDENLFNIRAETLSTVFFIWSCVFWTAARDKNSGKDNAYNLMTGILYGLAIFSSPRYLLLAGVYIFLTRDNRHLFVVKYSRFVWLATGSMLSISCYVFLSNMTISELHFSIHFSSLLQKIGGGNSYGITTYITTVITTAILAILYRLENNKSIQHRAVELWYLLCIILVSKIIAGNYTYSQDWNPAIVLITLIICRIEKQPIEYVKLHCLYFGVVVAVSTFMIVEHDHLYTGGKTMLNKVSDINATLSTVPANESVMLESKDHLIAVNDASYYTTILGDDPDRICSAVRATSPKWRLPSCDFLVDIERNKPYMITTNLKSLAVNEDLKKIKAIIAREYVNCGTQYIRVHPSQAIKRPTHDYAASDYSPKHLICIQLYKALDYTYEVNLEPYH